MDAVTEVLPALSREPFAIDPARLLMPGGEHREIEIEAGASVADLVSQVPEALHPFLRIYNHGAVIDPTAWNDFNLRAGDQVLIAVIPAGGGDNSKMILGAILTIAVAVFAPYAVGLAGGAMTASGVAGTALSGLGMAVSAGITMVGTMAIAAMIKPPTVNTGNVTAGSPKSYTLTGQSNAARPFSSCLVIYGRHKLMPAMATNPNVDNFASTSTLTALYDFGLGYVQLEDIRIGDVPIGEYQPQLVVHTNSLCRELQLNANRIGYDSYALDLKQNAPITVRTKNDSFAADMDLTFPKGIFQAAPKFGQLPYWAEFVAWWRLVGTEQWNEVPIDWYHGAWGKEYTAASQATILYAGPSEVSPTAYWYEYLPTSSPADLRAKRSAYLGLKNLDDPYLRAKPAPAGRVTFQYPDGPINEENYFARYPEIRKRGWTRGATDHFESIGSRESRDPGVRVLIPQLGYYDPNPWAGYASTLHNWDYLYSNSDPDVGAWKWMNDGSPPPPEQVVAPFIWQMKYGTAFDEALYRARYPDVANAIGRGEVASGWDHFVQYGAFEGRDPYPGIASRAVRMIAQWVGPYYMRIFFQFPTPGEYELRVARTDKIEDGTDAAISQASGGDVTARFNESTLTLLRSYQWGLPVQPRLLHTMMEMRVTATDKLQGIVQNLSAICTSVLPVTNDGVNFWYAPTRNPAWIALDLLTSEKNPKPLARSQIEWASWLHLAGICDTLRYWVANGQPVTAPRYTCDIVVDSYGTVKDLVESILSGCRASLILTTAGTWGVLHDEEKTVARQLITPANSWGFKGARTFSVFPHALRVNFVNRDNYYNKDEVTVYADGYSAGNASIFETLDTFGITDWPHAWAYGRFMLAQGIQRSELFTLTLDVENLLVQRGDMVMVAHDVPKVGGFPSRVVAVSPTATTVTIDADFAVTPNGYAVRLANGSLRTGLVYGYANESTFILDSVAGIEPDDLIVLGEYTRQTQPYLVQRISPGSDLTAELTLCKYVREIYDADIGALPPWDPGFDKDYINGTDLVSREATASQTMYYVNREPLVDVLLQWKTTGIGLAYHRITVTLPSLQRISIDAQHVPQSFQWTRDALRQRSFFDIPLQFEIVPVNTLGYPGAATYVTITLVPDRIAPGAVKTFGVNVQKENVDIWWLPPDDPDISHYVLRYTPEQEYPEWDASQQLAVIGWPTTKTSAGARTGSYGIRVIDTSGNASEIEWRRTTIAHLPDINTIAVRDDALRDPVWPGKRSHCLIDGLDLTSEGPYGQIYPEAVYYVWRPIDLGDIYEVRISSKIQAHGKTISDEQMIDWVPSMNDLAAMTTRDTSDLWDAWLEVRTANTMMVVAEWQPNLTIVDPMAMGAPDAWTEWRPCVVGDFTGRMLQFRIIMRSYHPGVKVVVTAGRIEVDMPDRIDAYGDVDVPAAGLDFVFPVAYRYLESVAITINGNDEPVIAEVTNKQATSFRVRLINTITHVGTDGYIDILTQGYGRRREDSI